VTEDKRSILDDDAPSERLFTEERKGTISLTNFKLEDTTRPNDFTVNTERSEIRSRREHIEFYR
jgi:hypothetical protein